MSSPIHPHASSLGAKLDALDLTADESALLHDIVAAASGAETAGYGSIGFVDLLPKIKVTDERQMTTGFSASGTGNLVDSKTQLAGGGEEREI